MSVAPDRPLGPPLNALRAFEAAARHQSFVLAGAELGVTPGAISQHVRTLEDWTGTPLFQRRNNRVVLTETGRALAPAFEEAFDAVGRAVALLRSARPEAEVRIAALPSVAQLWLSPRLAPIRQRLSHVRLSITALEQPPNLGRELFDLSLFLSSGTGGGSVLERDRIFPVCAPEVAARIAAPEDLAREARLLDQTWAADWDLWSRVTATRLPPARTVARFSLYSLAVEEARAGAGVLMGHACLVERYLADGSLVRALPGEAETGAGLVMQVSSASSQSREVSEIAAFLKHGAG